MNWESGDRGMRELRRLLPAAKKMLGANKVHVISCLNREHMLYAKTKDRAIQEEGYQDDMPFIREGNRHANKSDTGLGLALYETRGSHPIQYVIMTLKKSEMWDYTGTYGVIAEKQLYRLERYWRGLAKYYLRNNKPPVLYPGILDDVIKHSIGFLLDRKKIQEYDVKIRRGIALYGKPGNGKTMLCRWIQRLCAENNIKYRTVTGSELDDAYKDNKMGDIFREAPVIFFDDIDISYLNRSSANGNAKVACSLLSAMDGFDQSPHSVRIFTTNEDIRDIDPAFTRPGRIDRKFELLPPTPELRSQLIKTWHRDLLQSVGPKQILSATKDFSFADLECLKSLMVTNFLVEKPIWDLDLALQEFSQSHLRATNVGFHGEPKSSN